MRTPVACFGVNMRCRTQKVTDGKLTSCVTVATNLTTPQKTNMSPENQWLEDVFPIETVPF